MTDQPLCDCHGEPMRRRAQPRADGTFGYLCRVRIRESARLLKERRRADGLCHNCGVRPQDEGVQVCSLCRATTNGIQKRLKAERIARGVCYSCESDGGERGLRDTGICRPCYGRDILRTELSNRSKRADEKQALFAEMVRSLGKKS